MSIRDEFIQMVDYLDTNFSIPQITEVFLPPFSPGGQPRDAQFMAFFLEGTAVGISYILVPDQNMASYQALQPEDFVGQEPMEFALQFGSQDPVKNMISMAAVNAICQHVIKETNFHLDTVTDPLGLLSPKKGDIIGMVGLFSGLIKRIKKAGAELVIIEKKQELIEKYHALPVTNDVTRLADCNKVFCTGTTVLNNTLDEVLSHISPAALVSVVGPTAGYFPDPMFARGVDILGGRLIEDSGEFHQRLRQRKPWTGTTQKICFQKKDYRTMIHPG